MWTCSLTVRCDWHVHAFSKKRTHTVTHTHNDQQVFQLLHKAYVYCANENEPKNKRKWTFSSVLFHLTPTFSNALQVNVYFSLAFVKCLRIRLHARIMLPTTKHSHVMCLVKSLFIAAWCVCVCVRARSRMCRSIFIAPHRYQFILKLICERQITELFIQSI